MDDVVNALEAFVQGLNGRRLKVQAGDEVYTDTETLFLPEIVSHFDDRDDNFQLYKAIYGFSGMTRKRCEIYKIKSFDDEYNEDVKGRISGIQPKDYTRIGVTIRHLSALQNEVETRTRLLITLSDGKPDDYDGYRGAYGIEDTRMALIEAKRDGIHPFCITIDKEARDYLPHMYGSVNYVVIDEVRKLPLKVSDIYCRLTT